MVLKAGVVFPLSDHYSVGKRVIGNAIMPFGRVQAEKSARDLFVLPRDGFMIDPKEMIRRLSVEELCQTADGYFQSIADPTPLMAKPFTSLVDAPDLLQSMGNILAGLKLGKTMLVLEFAAGTCWFSRFLNQLQCRTISCDVSQVALDMGRKLFAENPVMGSPVAEPVFLHFDGRKLNIPSESVDRIICHDGLHHVPNQEEIISELARVLKPGGIAAFREPGRYHSRSPQSQFEMKNYNVLENDIILEEIFSLAQKSGFTDIRIKVVGDMDVSLREYQSLIWHFPGPTLVFKVIRNIRKILTNKTVFFLYKGEFVSDSRSHYGLAHRISSNSGSMTVRAGELLSIPLEISNTGSARWLKENIQGIGVVNLGTHIYDGAGNLLSFEFSRHPMEKATEPGQTIAQEISVRIESKGAYSLAIDLVSEGISWFETLGSTPLVIKIEVI